MPSTYRSANDVDRVSSWAHCLLGLGGEEVGPLDEGLPHRGGVWGEVFGRGALGGDE
jgi:hypothetical protein